MSHASPGSPGLTSKLEGAVAIAWVPIRTGCSSRVLPLLFIDGRIDWSVLEFMSSARIQTLSASSLAHRAAGIRLGFTYLAARRASVADLLTDRHLQDSLADAMLAGTAADGEDRLRLNWKSRTAENARLHLRAIDDFCAYLRDTAGDCGAAAADTRAGGEPSGSQVRHRMFRRENSLFRHMAPARWQAAAPSGSLFGLGTGQRFGSPGRVKSVPAAFPEKHVAAFFETGLRRRRVTGRTGNEIADSYNVRDVLYFLILMFGGLRGAEPLHLYVGDIQPDTECGQGAAVFLWHPADGPAPDGEPPPGRRDGRMTRREYLARRFGRRPRNEMNGHPQKAGWKTLLLDENVPRLGQRTRVYWQTSAIGHTFWELHSVYMRHERPAAATHPYYFVSLDRSSYGGPWTEDGAQDAFRRAMRRMGLEADSSAGLCRHAMRHRFAQYLVDLQVEPERIQVILHHQNAASQECYARCRPGDVARALEAAGRKTEGGLADFDPGNLGVHWRSDPMRIFRRSAVRPPPEAPGAGTPS